MIIIKLAADLISYCQKKLNPGYQRGLVPTMGALHQGHISLINRSKQFSDITISSIFINPTQFNNADDFKKYPVTLENDIYLLEKNGCDVLFLPDIKEIYPGGLSFEKFDLGYLENILEGKYRPGHFQGVCQVVKRLLNIIAPHAMYLGQKDYQQCMILKELLSLMNSKIKLNICPTLREPDGLAMSSRNLRLDGKERQLASEIYKNLSLLKDNIQPGNVVKIKNLARQNLEQKNFKVDYIEIADANTLQIVDDWNGTDNLIILAAAYINNIRLIDNILLTPNYNE